MSEIAPDIADHHAFGMRRKQHAHNPQARPGSHGGKHVGETCDLVFSRFGGHGYNSILIEL